MPSDAEVMIVLLAEIKEALVHGFIKKQNDTPFGGDTHTPGRFSQSDFPVADDYGYSADTERRFFGDSLPTVAWHLLPVLASVSYPRQLNWLRLSCGSLSSSVCLAIVQEDVTELSEHETPGTPTTLTDNDRESDKWIDLFTSTADAINVVEVSQYVNNSVVIPPNHKIIVFNSAAGARLWVIRMGLARLKE